MKTRRGFTCAALTLLLAGGLLSGPVDGDEEDLRILLDGVTSIAKPGIPGPFALFGDDVFAVVAGETRGGSRHAVVAAARHGRGRVVAFGHTGYFGSMETGETGRLVLNALSWLAKGKRKPAVVTWHADGMADFLKKQGLKVEQSVAESPGRALSGAKVLFVQAHDIRDEFDKLRAFVRRGGSLCIAGLGWGWQQLNPKKKLLTDHPGNRLLAPVGIVWADGYIDRIVPVSSPIDKEMLRLCHGGEALSLLMEEKEHDLKQVSGILTSTIRSIPTEDTLFLPRLRRWLSERDAKSLYPLSDKDAVSRLAVTLRHEENKRLPFEEIAAEPGCDLFPGAVPANAPRVTGRVALDPSVPGWASTGYYAPAGKVVSIDIPEEWTTAGLFARIGCHSDRLWDKATWKRHPDVSRRYRLENKRTKIAAPHGGLIYIEIPHGLPEGKLRVTLHRAVHAPRFVLGTTEPEKWLKSIRRHPAPWAELETSKIILTLPSTAVRGLDDPVSLLEFWDEVLDCYAELGARPLPRRPERMVCDTQISAGYMHSGYPIMMHLDMPPVVTDKEALLTEGHGGVWGLWHELGHNHQQAAWTFGGTGEVTCNLFTLYVMDRACGINPAEAYAARGTLPRVRRHIIEGAPFEKWKRDPFLALGMYVQVQEVFGWEPFKKAFAQYRDMPAEELPKTDWEKRDQWLVSLSRAVGRNLGPFFEIWGVPVSGEARQSVAALDEWLPESLARISTETWSALILTEPFAVSFTQIEWEITSSLLSKEGPALFFETSAGRQTLTGPPLSITREKNRFEAEYATTDGRRASVAIAPGGKETVSLSFSVTPLEGVGKLGAVFLAPPEERYYGLMERVVDGAQEFSWRDGIEEALDIRGRKVSMLVKPTLGIYTPFHFSSAGYGVSVKGTWPGEYDMAARESDRVTFAFAGPSLELDMIPGPTALDVVSKHALLTGPAIVPPRWTFSHWRWRDNHTQKETFYEGTPNRSPYNSMVVEDVLMMKALDIPFGVYWVDRPWAAGPMGYSDFEWDRIRFPDPEGMIAWLSKHDVRFLLWIAPWIMGDMVREAHESGFLLPTTPGPAARETKEPALIDLTNPAAVRWWGDHIEKVAKMGTAGFKLDRCDEIVPFDPAIVLHDGRTAAEAHNDYPRLYVKAVHDVMKRLRGDDFVLMPRAAYRGSQKYGVFWGGDIRAGEWGLRAALIALQRSSMIGFPLWGSDTGGYWGREFSRENLARWLAFSAFCPIMETGPTHDRAPWDMPAEPGYDAELIAIWRLYATIHTRLIDYTHRLAREASERGMPIVRPLFLVYPDSADAYESWDEYLYGEEILVGVIWQNNQSNFDMFLPAGEWKDAWTGEVQSGPKRLGLDCPLYKIPIFVKAASSIDLGDLEELYRRSLELAAEPPDLDALQRREFGGE